MFVPDMFHSTKKAPALGFYVKTLDQILEPTESVIAGLLYNWFSFDLVQSVWLLIVQKSISQEGREKNCCDSSEDLVRRVGFWDLFHMKLTLQTWIDIIHLLKEVPLF